MTFVVSAALPSIVHAHPETAPALVNRYVTLATQDATAFVSVALLFGAQPGSAVRAQADLNHDGVIDAAEQERARARYQAEATRWLKLQVDGKDVPFAPIASLDVGPSTSVAGGAVVAEATMKLPLTQGARHHFRLFPRAHPPPQGETEVTVILGPGWRLASGNSQQRSVKLTGPAPPDFVVSFELEASQSRPSRWPWLALAATALATAAAMVLRRRKI
ncbi:MAG: hypothetical protein SF187_15445 [Deltaproteobacteria bacterium]|nr:hypothetical protein [Deltaproteobacteria bacterium]